MTTYTFPIAAIGMLLVGLGNGAWVAFGWALLFATGYLLLATFMYYLQRMRGK